MRGGRELSVDGENINNGWAEAPDRWEAFFDGLSWNGETGSVTLDALQTSREMEIFRKVEPAEKLIVATC